MDIVRHNPGFECLPIQLVKYAMADQRLDLAEDVFVDDLRSLTNHRHTHSPGTPAANDPVEGAEHPLSARWKTLGNKLIALVHDQVQRLTKLLLALASVKTLRKIRRKMALVFNAQMANA